MRKQTAIAVLVVLLGAGVVGSVGGAIGFHQGARAERTGYSHDPRREMLRADTGLQRGKEAEVLPGRKLLTGWTVTTKPGKVTDCCGVLSGYVATVVGKVRNDNPGPVGSDSFLLRFRLSGDNSSAGWVICDTPRQNAGQTSSVACESVVLVDPNFDRIELGDPNE